MIEDTRTALKDFSKSPKNERSVGYIAGNRDKGLATVMIHDGELKHYYHADLNDVLECLTGRKNFAVLKEWGKP